jgi:hypothetical protein
MYNPIQDNDNYKPHAKNYSNLSMFTEVINTNSIVFGLTRQGIETTVYRTRGEHASHYTIDAVFIPP